MKDKRTIFKVLEGGLAKTTTPGYQTFSSAWITNTRLMGVVAMGIHWHGGTEEDPSDLYQFFYFDVEELGLDRYEECDGRNHTLLSETEASFIGGLGGRKVAISQKEAVFLYQKFLAFNHIYQIPMPEGSERAAFLCDMDGDLSPEEEMALFRRACTRITSRTMLANYYLMRSFGKDLDAAATLREDGLSTDLFPELSIATFHKNQVRMAEDQKSAQCESLIETEDFYCIALTELTFTGMKIAESRPLSWMKISDQEAFLNLTHSEFVTVYDYSRLPAEFRRGSSEYTRNATIRQEHGGRTFMIYHPDNEHVGEQTYYLFHDLIGTYHMTGQGQLIAAAATLQDIRRLEVDLHFSDAKYDLTMSGSYEFNQPVLSQFLQSGYTDFNRFIEAITLQD